MTDPEYTEPFWDDPRWRASTVASLVMRGISARRVDEIVATMVRRYREQDARDRAHDGRA